MWPKCLDICIGVIPYLIYRTVIMLHRKFISIWKLLYKCTYLTALCNLWVPNETSFLIMNLFGPNAVIWWPIGDAKLQYCT